MLHQLIKVVVEYTALLCDIAVGVLAARYLLGEELLRLPDGGCVSFVATVTREVVQHVPQLCLRRQSVVEDPIVHLANLSVQAACRLALISLDTIFLSEIVTALLLDFFLVFFFDVLRDVLLDFFLDFLLDFFLDFLLDFFLDVLLDLVLVFLDLSVEVLPDLILPSRLRHGEFERIIEVLPDAFGAI